MQTVADASTVDLTRTRISLRDSVVFSPQVYGDTTFYHVEQAAKSAYHRIGYAEYVFLSLLDGHTSFCEALAITARTLGPEALPQPQALTLYTWALEKEVADFATSDVSPDTRDKASKAVGNPLQKLNPFWIRIPFGKPDAFLRLLSPIVGWLFSPLATCAGICLMLLAVFRLSTDWQKFTADAENVFAPNNWVWLLLAWIILKTLHEIGHGLVCQRHGGSVRETGIILAFFAPLAYVDVTSCWSFRSRWQRIHTALAGMYVELLLASAAVFIWAQSDSRVLTHLMYNVIVMASVSTILFNANPLMRFDGYYVLSDLLQIPNLYARSSEVVQQCATQLLFGVRATNPELTGRQYWVLLVYGMAAFVWRIFICLTMMLAASVLFHGAGILLSIAGLVAWIAMPLVALARKIVRVARSTPLRAVRGTVIGGIATATIGGCLLLAPIPFQNTAPGVVSLPDGCVVRSEIDGFIATVHVTNRQSVKEGQLLFTLRNPEIVSNHRDLELQYQQELIRHKTAIKEHDAGAAGIALGNLKSLREQLAETTAEVTALQVSAKTTGTVIARNLVPRTETFVRKGDELLVIDDHQSRELRVSVAQEDVSGMESLLGLEIPVRVGSRPILTGSVTRIIPRASRHLREQSLAATEGGPLAVANAKSDNDDHPAELTVQRFEAVVQFRDHEQISQIGERGYISVASRQKTLASFAVHEFREWMRTQIATAHSSIGN